jgi:hypothetical protein
MASAVLTPARVVSLLVIPPATVALACAWWAIDQAFYAYRLQRNLRSIRT